MGRISKRVLAIACICCELSAILVITPMLSLPVQAAPKPAPTLKWRVSSMQPSRNYKLSSLVSTNSTAPRKWKVTGACTLTTTVVITKKVGTCRVTLSIYGNSRFRSTSSTRSFSLSSSTTTGSTVPPSTTTTTTIPPPTTTTTTTTPTPKYDTSFLSCYNENTFISKWQMDKNLNVDILIYATKKNIFKKLLFLY